MAYTRRWAVNSQIARLRLKAENHQLRQCVALLTEETRITKRVDEEGPDALVQIRDPINEFPDFVR